MKLGIFFILILINISSSATTYYISPSGNDASGTGAITNPWKTLRKATQTVTISGDIIHVNSGTYLETAQSQLRPGVSIEGDGITSIITATLTAQYVSIIEASSAEGTNGNQHISNIMFDGRNLATSWAVSIMGRSNVSIYNCTFINFKESAVMWAGRNDFNLLAPSVYATGNSFHDNIVTNCATADVGYGRGGFQFGGQNGMLIYANTLTETGRPAGTQGWPIKNCNEGHTKNCKIYNNVIKAAPFPYPGNGDNNYWNFAIELFYEEGLEIYGNTIEGSLDMNNQSKGGSAYSVYIHDNIIGHNSPAATWEDGIILEYETNDAIIERNIIKNCMEAITFSLRTGSTINNVRINNNLAYNIGITDGSKQGFAVRMITGDDIYSSQNLQLLNNTFIALSGANSPYWGIELPSGTGSSNIMVKNNLMMNFATSVITTNIGAAINTLSIQNNLFNLNGNNNTPYFFGGTPVGYTNSNNLTVNPLLVAPAAFNYTLQATSPAIDAGLLVGLAFNGSAPDIGYAEFGSVSNIAPTANAGLNQSITLPTNTVSLSGSGNDPDGSIIAYTWTKVSGPAAGTITNSASAATTVTALTIAGTYQFELKVTDNSGAIGRDTMQVTVNAAANIVPTANAGLDQNITLPTNSVNLTGSGNDPDGSITAYLWTKVSGPAAGAITNAASAATTVTALTIAGTYQFELKVTDNSGAVDRDTMQVTVNAAANIAPTANAGLDQNITLPTNSVSLTGSGNDPDGSITAYLWTKVSGPAAGTITNSASAATTVTALVAGIYKFELKVTDNSGAVARDTMQVTVNAAANIVPTANAGADQSITLPVNSSTLLGSGNDPDGSISAYLWTKVSGPAAGTITNATAAVSSVTALVQGVYLFELKVTDNSGAVARDTMQLTVNAAAANIAPTANAGLDQNITLPTNSVNLTGSGNDPDGSITAYLWTKVSGPAAGAITNAASAATTVTALTIAGTYQFELKVTDNSGAVDRDTMQVTVNAAANIAPTANAGLDQNITLPTNSVSLTGSGNDPDGSITAYLWTKISGPAAGTITNSASAATTVTALTAGIYKFELKVTDNSGAIGRDTMQVTVNAAANIAPTANAGLDQNITLPTNTVSLSGSGNDPDGSIIAYTWTKVSGPAAGTITNSASAATTVTALTIAGTYQFELKVTDNSGAIGRDTMQVTVNAAANIAPTANAGLDQNITLPTNSVNLTGSGNDPDGSITAYLWTKVSGPAAGAITNAASAATTVTALTIAGTYQFELKVTDNSGAVDRDTMQVTVNAAANIAPTANAGLDQNITLPTNSVSLTGSGNDPDGSITAYLWTKISGPAAGTITNSASAATTVTALVAGIYKFELKVTDNSGAVARDTMQVTVNAAANIVPTANAGADQSITLPVNSSTLLGSGNDPDGSISAYLWTKVSGPAAGTITNATAAVSSVTALVQGVYLFELKVTDNSGAVARDTMQLTVNAAAANIAPTANAGLDQSITLPTNSVSLTGSGNDPDGSITAYLWTKVSGPAAGAITNSASAATTVTALVAGIYKFELKVTDNSGAVTRDTMQVIVFAPNIPPVANAGLDQSITLPTNTADLIGSGSDIDGTVVTYKWTRISGPADGTILNSATAVTSVTGLTQGIYQFELKVTDNNGASSTDIMQVTVNAANIPPVANAGPDQSVVLPFNSATLNGSGTDADGTVISYKWRQIAGPADKLTSLNTPVTVLNNLIEGNYSIELTVTDNKGATGKDTVNISVVQAGSAPNNSATIFPNPITNNATVNINRKDSKAMLLVVITDMAGNSIYKKQLAGGSYNIKQLIDFNNFAKGFYLVTVYFDNSQKQTLKVEKL